MLRTILILSLFFSSLFAQSEEEYTRNFTLSSAYVEGFFNNNEGLVDFPISAIDAYGKLYDLASDSFTNHWWSRLLSSIGELPFSFWYANALFAPFHEFGHARAIKAFGGDYSYSTMGYGTVLRSNIKSYWELSFWRLITPPFFFPGAGPASTHYSGKITEPADYANFLGGQNGIDILVSAAGLNNQTFLAKRLAQDLYERGAHFTYLQHYIGNKISGFVYSQMDRNDNPNDDPAVRNRGDVSSVLMHYNAKGYNIQHRDIEMQSLLSLISGTTAALFKGYYDYIAYKQSIVKPIEIFGLRLPDLNSYINAQGLSYEIVSGYRWSKDLFFDLAYEFIWKGGSAHQVTAGGHLNLAWFEPILNELWLEPELVISKSVGGSLSVRYAPFSTPTENFWHRLSYFADVTLYNAYTLFGQRNSPQLNSRTGLSVSGFAGINLRY
jgi:hypothetical protein